MNPCVIRVEKSPNLETVYNLEVDEMPEFFANGILVHNSLDALRYLVSWLTEPGDNGELVYMPVQIGPAY